MYCREKCGEITVRKHSGETSLIENTEIDTCATTLFEVSNHCCIRIELDFKEKEVVLLNFKCLI